MSSMGMEERLASESSESDPESGLPSTGKRSILRIVTVGAAVCCIIAYTSRHALSSSSRSITDKDELLQLSDGSVGKPGCVPCGQSLWLEHNQSADGCCKGFCYKGYWWTEYGSTLDCSAQLNCFLNLTYYVELSGSTSMAGSLRSTATSVHDCQKRCADTTGCQHFSFWNDGGCHLTSYTAYPKKYDGPASVGVMAGPKSCMQVMFDYEEGLGPQVQLEAAPEFAPFVPIEAKSCGGLHKTYTLSWKSEGSTFFDKWQFIEKSETHGAEWYLNKTEAFRVGVVSATQHGAIMRVGDQICPFKRRSALLHSAQAWRPDKGFMLVMKYKHVPYGAGIWPAFWLVNSDVVWPKGGELDILEYANDDSSKVTFHTDKNCSIDQAKFKRCMDSPLLDDDTITHCYTNYTGNELGCKPRQIRRTGQWFAENPGVIATVWDASGVSVYHIPEASIPFDLATDKPQPNSWSSFRIAYLPFKSSSTCVNLAKPQEIVLNIALCGDWAGGAWWNSKEAKATEFVPPYCIPGNVGEPATDCCTAFMCSPTSEEYLKQRAYFDIDYIKVFEPEGAERTNYAAGTFRNGGKPPE